MTSFLRFLFNIANPWPAILLADFVRYLIAAVLVTVVVALTSSRVLKSRSVRNRAPEARQRLREFANSVVTACVFGTVGLGVYFGSRAGVFHIYASTAHFGVGYWIFSLILVVVAHDAYFYWAHRFMHRRTIFSWAHSTHHRSVAPTQWAAYSFAPGEAFVQALFLPLFLLIVPLHVGAITLWGIHQVIRNAFGHAGVELEPSSWLKGWWGRHFTTTLHHDLHHAQGRHNFGLYFTWWDRLCNTEHPEYRERLQALIERMDNSNTNDVQATQSG